MNVMILLILTRRVASVVLTAVFTHSQGTMSILRPLWNYAEYKTSSKDGSSLTFNLREVIIVTQIYLSFAEPGHCIGGWIGLELFVIQHGYL
jgi:hypothetical protein